MRASVPASCVAQEATVLRAGLVCLAALGGMPTAPDRHRAMVAALAATVPAEQARVYCVQQARANLRAAHLLVCLAALGDMPTAPA